MTTTQLATIPSGTYTVDTSHSHVGFVARHAMVTKVRGSFNEFSATAHFDATDPAKSSVEVSIDAASVDTRSEQRDGHIRGGDFFDVENFPTITFVSSAVDLVDDETVRVTGDLTIKGSSKPVTIDFAYEGSAVDPFGNDRAGFEGSVVVNRRDWDLTWNAALEAGGLLVSDKVTLEFSLSTIKAA